MVAKDESNKPVQVPGLILETPQQIRRFAEAIKRKELRQNYREEVEHMKTSVDYEQYLELLKSERCLVTLKN